MKKPTILVSLTILTEDSSRCTVMLCLDLKPVDKHAEDPFEVILDRKKEENGFKLDTELTADHLKELVAEFKEAIKEKTGKEFPEDPMEQLWGAIGAVFGSWMNERAIVYRKLNNIPASWGTAVNVQSMVFGNMGEDSGTGVAFTRDPAAGDKLISTENIFSMLRVKMLLPEHVLLFQLQN